MKMDSQKTLHATLESMGKIRCEKKIVESAVSGGKGLGKSKEGENKSQNWCSTLVIVEGF